MKILHVIDSLEINGGSMMCFEMASAMKRHFDNCEVTCLVVSKTGRYGRKNIIADKIASSYGWQINSINYDTFYKQSNQYRDCFVLHHRLECTRPLKFKSSPRLYLVINHTVQKLNRLRKFEKANVVVSVCEYLRKRSPHLPVPHKVVLNGLAKNEETSSIKGKFITGRCHRLPAVKFSIDSLECLDKLDIPGHKHYLIGPENRDILSYQKKHKKTCLEYLDKIDDQQKKKELIRSFDVYFYDTYGPEGASAAILEGLAAGVPVLCKKLGGNEELVKDEINGFYFKNLQQAQHILSDLYHHPDKLQEMKRNVSKDFDERLTIEKCVKKYLEIMEKFVKK